MTEVKKFKKVTIYQDAPDWLVPFTWGVGLCILISWSYTLLRYGDNGLLFLYVPWFLIIILFIVLSKEEYYEEIVVNKGCHKSVKR